MGRYGGYYYGGWPVYVPVAERRRRALKKLSALKKKGQKFEPVELLGRQISTTFWGNAWCDHLETYSDYSNRLPRGRSYVRNGSVLDLQISEGKVISQVSGSHLYKIHIQIKPLDPKKWKNIIHTCAGKIDSLIELLQGQLSHGVMEVLTHREKGMFPSPQQISLKCSCPDWAEMCKHVAATLYGVGARLDHKPELLFVLRGVNKEDLLTAGTRMTALSKKAQANQKKKPALKGQDLSKLFDIDLAKEPAESVSRR